MRRKQRQENDTGSNLPALVRTPQTAAVAAKRGLRVRSKRRGTAPEVCAVALTEIEATVAVHALALMTQEDEPELMAAARSAMAKIVAASPPPLRDSLRAAAANAAQPESIDDYDDLVEIIEDAIREERKLRIVYDDQEGEGSVRTIKPLALAESRRGESVAAWCELRRDFRNFRIDRIEAIVALELYFKGEREALLDGYLAEE